MKTGNTGLGLIKATIERAQNEKSLFNSALKKLVNSSEEELDDFLKREKEKLDDFLKRKIDVKIKNSILRPISGGYNLTLKESDGSRLICNARDTFKSFIDPNFLNWGINKPGIATAETPVRVYEIVQDDILMGIFSALPGTWAKKCVSQDQIIEFCETLSEWLRQEGYITIFLIKKDENKPIDENNPSKNLAVVSVSVAGDGLYVRMRRLEHGRVLLGRLLNRVVFPQFKN